MGRTDMVKMGYMATVLGIGISLYPSCLVSGAGAAMAQKFGDLEYRREQISSSESLPLRAIQKYFLESFRHQTVMGDLATAFQGFGVVTRMRRGYPWPGRPDGPCHSFGESTRGRYYSEKEDEGTAGVGDCYRAFLDDQHRNIAHFNERSSGEIATMRSKVYEVPSSWGVDTMGANTRGNLILTSLHKLDHDLEQLEYLIKKGCLPPAFQELVEDYTHVRDAVAHELRGHSQLEPPGRTGATSTTGKLSTWHPTGFHRTLNPDLDWVAIEAAYLEQDLPLLWFDGFLTDEALQGVLEFCREATVFFDVRPGYLGAYVGEGLDSPWLLQIANELRERLPRVLEGMTLTNMWAYKYDSDTSMDGITVHADNAAVNLNFWVSPDESNLDPTTGGLVVYPTEPPNAGVAEGSPSTEAGKRGPVDPQWNNWSKKEYIKTWLKEEGHLNTAVNIPYRQNRAVLFDSRLLHETAPFRFKTGYENRRINLTFLFSPAEVEETFPLSFSTLAAAAV